MATVTQIRKAPMMLQLHIWSEIDQQYNACIGGLPEGWDLALWNIERYEIRAGSLQVYLKPIY